MYSLSISEEAKKDIRDLMATDEDAAALVIALLDEIAQCQDLLNELTIHGSEPVAPELDVGFNVQKFLALFRKGLNLWRLKVLDHPELARYRIVYGYKAGTGGYYVLGVVPRNFNYDPAHPISQRIVRDYRDYCE